LRGSRHIAHTYLHTRLLEANELDTPMDAETLLHSLAGGAIVAAALTFARLLLEYGFRGGERRQEGEERRHRLQRDAEARLERVLQDRLADADRRLERCELDMHAERVRSAALEQDNARLVQAYELLKEQHLSLQAEHARLVRRQRLPTS
jgi:C4-dicarboxylate-specific signal transduction histidine kinase